MYDAVLDTGATDSIVASSLVSDPNRKGYCAVKVGHGHYTYSEGEKSVDVCMDNFTLPHVCIVMETSAFPLCLGMNFIRQNAKTILGLIFTPSRHIVKNPETDDLSLVSLSEKSCQKEGGNGLPPARASLRIPRREAYSLLPSLREQVLIDLGHLRPTVDLDANPKNHTELLYCTPPNSCYAYKWHNFQWLAAILVDYGETCRAIGAEENKKPRKRRTTRKNKAQNRFFRPQKPPPKFYAAVCLGHSQKKKNNRVATATKMRVACPKTPSKVRVLGARDLCALQQQRR